MDALSAGLEQEIQSMSDLINQVYYQILKTGDGTQTTRDASLQDFYRQHNKQLVNVALYLKSGETVWSTEQTPAPAADVVKQPWFQPLNRFPSVRRSWSVGKISSPVCLW